MAFFNNRVVYLAALGITSSPPQQPLLTIVATGQVVFYKLKRSGQHPTLKLLQRYKQHVSDKVSAAFSVGGGLVLLRLGNQQFAWNAQTLVNIPRQPCLEQSAINVQAASKAEIVKAGVSPLLGYSGVAVVLTATQFNYRVDYQFLDSRFTKDR